MKSYYALFIACFFTTCCFAGNPVQKAVAGQGIFYRLSYYRSAVQALTTAILTDTTSEVKTISVEGKNTTVRQLLISPDERKRVAGEYQKLAAELDAILNEYDYEANQNTLVVNKLRVLDANCKKDTTANGYPVYEIKIHPRAQKLNHNLRSYFKNADAFLNNGNLLQRRINNASLADFDPVAAFGALGTFIQGIMTYQQTKTAAMLAILDKARLADLSALVK